MSRPTVTRHSAESAERPPLTGPQEAAVAKLAYAAEQPGSIALLCGPAGVGKTTIFRQIAADGLPSGQTVRLIAWHDMLADRGDLTAGRGLAVGDDDAVPGVLLVDDAHRALAHELVECVERCQRLHRGIVLVLAGEGRLVSLVASDARLEQFVRLRSSLPTFTLTESRSMLGSMLPVAAADAAREAVIITIHEIAGGVPAIAVRLAEMAAMLLDADPAHRLVPDDIETIHRRLSLSAA
jgi:DNA transposition AAA+ family ATPase